METTGHERLAVAAVIRLGLMRADRWPMVAAYLVAAGVDGEHVVGLAGLSQAASGWEVDQYVPDARAEAGLRDLTVDEAADPDAEPSNQHPLPWPRLSRRHG